MNELEYFIKQVEDFIYYAVEWLKWKSIFLTEWVKDHYLIIYIIFVSIFVLPFIFHIARSYVIESVSKKWREDENKKLE